MIHLHNLASALEMFWSTFKMNRQGKIYVVAMPPDAPANESNSEKKEQTLLITKDITTRKELDSPHISLFLSLIWFGFAGPELLPGSGKDSFQKCTKPFVRMFNSMM